MSFINRLRGMFSGGGRNLQDRRPDARQQLESLLSRGLVEKTLLLPAEFSGPDEPRNVTYLPPEPAARKRAFDAEVRRRVERGEQVGYRATPDYDNDSFVPARLHLDAGGAPLLKEVIEIASHRTWEAEPS